MKLKPHVNSVKRLINKNKMPHPLLPIVVRAILSHAKALRASTNLHVKDSIKVN